MNLKKIIQEEVNDFDWVGWTEPTSPKNLDDDELHRIYYVARKAELISELISGNVYIKIENPKRQHDLEKMFFDMGYKKFDGSQKVRSHRGLQNYWAKGDYVIVYNNGVTNKTIDVIRKNDMENHKVRRGSDFSLSI